MSKIIIVGRLVSLVSALTLAQIQQLQKFEPKALVLVDDNKKEHFRVAADSKPSASNVGIAFSDQTDAGFARIQLPVPENLSKSDEIKAYITDKFGLMQLNLNDVETIATAAKATLDAKLKAVNDGMTVVTE